MRLFVASLVVGIFIAGAATAAFAQNEGGIGDSPLPPRAPAPAQTDGQPPQPLEEPPRPQIGPPVGGSTPSAPPPVSSTPTRVSAPGAGYDPYRPGHTGQVIYVQSGGPTWSSSEPTVCTTSDLPSWLPSSVLAAKAAARKWGERSYSGPLIVKYPNCPQIVKKKRW
ncbi:MAG: hypothetical protein FJX76_14325 [Armatimonadetes bacterium]|nr:hypothetical protein [Armatimonadota bacterium]